MRRLLLSACLLSALTVSAQTPEAIVSRDIGVFAAGVNPATGTPVVPATNVLNAQVTCGQPRVVPTGTQINPTNIRFDDPANPTTAQCAVAPATAAAIYTAVPLGTGYRVAIRARGATTQAAWSVVSNPFDHVAVPPAAVTGVVLD